jgi:hypothetical protein
MDEKRVSQFSLLLILDENVKVTFFMDEKRVSQFSSLLVLDENIKVTFFMDEKRVSSILITIGYGQGNRLNHVNYYE